MVEDTNQKPPRAQVIPPTDFRAEDNASRQADKERLAQRDAANAPKFARINLGRMPGKSSERIKINTKTPRNVQDAQAPESRLDIPLANIQPQAKQTVKATPLDAAGTPLTNEKPAPAITPEASAAETAVPKVAPKPPPEKIRAKIIERGPEVPAKRITIEVARSSAGRNSGDPRTWASIRVLSGIHQSLRTLKLAADAYAAGGESQVFTAQQLSENALQQLARFCDVKPGDTGEKEIAQMEKLTPEAQKTFLDRLVHEGYARDVPTQGSEKGAYRLTSIGINYAKAVLPVVSAETFVVRPPFYRPPQDDRSV